eukprot:scaffold319536_cov32-Tisochrysis_lutea.AAC.2
MACALPLPCRPIECRQIVAAQCARWEAFACVDNARAGSRTEQAWRHACPELLWIPTERYYWFVCLSGLHHSAQIDPETPTNRRLA